MRLALLVVGLSMLTGTVFAQEAAFKGSFAKSETACKAELDGEDWEQSLRVEAQGVSGYELFCGFVNMQKVRDEEGTLEFLAPAICGDDSGITRPDNFWVLIDDDGKRLTLQSQNEYVVPEETSLSGEYVLCE